MKLEPDRIFVNDGNIYTSAGVTAGIDLAPALVEEDLGSEMALRVAQNLVMFIRRPGGQTQFSAALDSQKSDREPLRELMTWAADHLDEDLSVEAMAARAHMSPRNFSRVFTRDVGKSPARFVERLASGRCPTEARRVENEPRRDREAVRLRQCQLDAAFVLAAFCVCFRLIIDSASGPQS